jgi:hypothetical protein
MQLSPELPIPNSYWVAPGRFLAGEYPGGFGGQRVRRRLDAFLEAGLDTFINLTDPSELPPYEDILREEANHYKLEPRLQQFPIRDRGLPTRAHMTDILNAIDGALDEGRNVYAHCWGGIGRTGTVVGCHLVRRGMSGNEALAQLARWWENDPRRAHYPRTPETDEQVQFIREWHELA